MSIECVFIMYLVDVRCVCSRSMRLLWYLTWYGRRFAHFRHSFAYDCCYIASSLEWNWILNKPKIAVMSSSPSPPHHGTTPTGNNFQYWKFVRAFEWANCRWYWKVDDVPLPGCLSHASRKWGWGGEAVDGKSWTAHLLAWTWLPSRWQFNLKINYYYYYHSFGICRAGKRERAERSAIA